MKYTNRFGLPDEIVHWLSTDDYDYNPDPMVISATTLMKPPRAVELERRWHAQMYADVSDLITLRYGTAIHDSFEKAGAPNTWQEERFYGQVGDFTVSGKVDLIRNMDKPTQRLADLKSTSAITYQKGSRHEDYQMQLSIYRYLIEKGYYKRDGNKVDPNLTLEDEGDIFYVFTDWSKAKAMKERDYPQSRIATITVKLWSTEDTEAWLHSRLDIITDARTKPDHQLPPCTKEELWQTATTWAVKKRGAKRAQKVFDNPRGAYAMASTKPELFVEERKGEVRRCHYCNAQPFCSQADQFKQEGLLS